MTCTIKWPKNLIAVDLVFDDLRAGQLIYNVPENTFAIVVTKNSNIITVVGYKTHSIIDNFQNWKIIKKLKNK